MKSHFKEIILISIAFLVLVVLFTRPLALKMDTHLPFPELSSDGSVFVWNAWWMEKAFSTGVSPFVTSLLFHPLPVSLTLHSMNWLNSTLTALLARPGHITEAFNLIYLLSFFMSALGMYLLIRQLHRSVIAAFAAGIAFAFTPYVLAHSLGHFNLTNIFPFPWFFLFLLHWQTADPLSWRRFPALVGAVLALLAAFYSDLNYFLFCLIMLAIYVYVHYWKWVPGIEDRPQRKVLFKIILSLSICIVFIISIILIITLTGGIDVSIGNIKISMHSLQNPIQLFWLLLMALALLIFLKSKRMIIRSQIVRPLTSTHLLQAGSAGLIFIAGVWPLAVQMIGVLWRGTYVAPETVWKSGFLGADLLSYLSPSPFHILWGKFGTAVHHYFPLSLSEKILFPGFVVLVMALWGFKAVPSKLKQLLSITGVVFFVLSLGQHLHIFGLNTWFALPFQLFKLLPFINNARVAARFGLIVIFVLIIFAAYGIDRLQRKKSSVWAVFVLILIGFEVLPVPMRTVRPEQPSIYRLIDKQSSGISLLEIPFGRKDGLKQTGSFRTESMYWQSVHGLPLVGGYIARIPDSFLKEVHDDKVLSAIIAIQDGNSAVPLKHSEVSLFRKKYQVGWVVTAPGYFERFHTFLTDELGLLKTGESEGYALYRWPVNPSNRTTIQAEGHPEGL